MESSENTALSTVIESTNDDNNLNDEEKIEKNKNEPSANETTKKDTVTDEKKKRKHRKYKTSINLTALKELEGTTAGSFLDLSNAVILIDGKPYDEAYIPLSKERKNDFKRLIEHYAVIDVIGKRKYYIKAVYNKKQIDELNEIGIISKRDNPKK